MFTKFISILDRVLFTLYRYCSTCRSRSVFVCTCFNIQIPQIVNIRPDPPLYMAQPLAIVPPIHLCMAARVYIYRGPWYATSFLTGLLSDHLGLSDTALTVTANNKIPAERLYVGIVTTGGHSGINYGIREKRPMRVPCYSRDPAVSVAC